MKLPDRIFALGGAGKAITYELLRSEWVQEEVIKPRPTPERLNVTIIDTAEEEKNRDLEIIQEIRASVRSKTDELRDPEKGRTGEINIEYRPLTENIQLHDKNDLVGRTVVPRIATGTGIDEDNWWVQPEFINENLDFATGVVRKRGLGKGLYYKAYAEDDDVRTAIDLPNKGKVAVIAGLGGGTGSGILLDIVSDLRETKRSAEITLFGVLPNDAEGKAENANAHAALSELEYLSLQGENLFKDRILIPINPTGFGGKTGNILETTDVLEEFDQAVVYLIAAYYNMIDMEDPFAQLPSYAPFTIGLPQILRYNVDAIKEAKSSITEMLAVKEDALEAEADVYSKIDRFLSKQRVDTDGELHDTDRAELESRLENTVSLIEFDLFEELEYESVSIFRDIVSEAKGETEDIGDRIDLIASSIRAGTTQVTDEDDGFVDRIDNQLHSVIENELTNIDRRAEVIRNIRGIGTNRVESTLSYLIALEDDGVNSGVRLNRLETKLEETDERHATLSEELEETEEELETRRDEQREEVDRRVEDWRRQVQTTHEELEECYSIETDRMVGDLEAELAGFAQEVDNAETIDQAEGNGTQVRQAINKLSSDLDQLGISITEEQQRIESSMEDLVDAKKAFIRMNEDEGLVEKISPFTTSAEEERENAQRSYRMKQGAVNDAGVFHLSRTGSSLSVEAEYDGEQFVDLVQEEITNRRDEITDAARERLEDPSNDQLDLLRQDLSSGVRFRSLAETFRDLVEETVVDTDDIERRAQQLEEELTDVSADLEMYEGTVELFKDLNNRRQAFVDAQDEYIDKRGSYDSDEEISSSSSQDDHYYIKKVKPHDVLEFSDDTDIESSGLFGNQTERQRLEGTLNELAERAQDPKYNGIRKRRMSNGRERYTDLELVVGVMSPAINRIGGEANVKSAFQGAYNLGGGANNYASFPVEAGGPWDVALGMFIGGVFLDNIRAEVEPGGYFDGYKQQRELDDTDILVHHTEGLENGHYVRRSETMNLEDPEDMDFFLRDEERIREDLLEECIETISLSGERIGDGTAAPTKK